MADQSEAIARLLLQQQIEDFLYHEVELLDERRTVVRSVPPRHRRG